MADEMYCGVGNLPPNKIRGTPEYCVQRNQVRYYGIIPIDESLLVTAKQKPLDNVKERLKFRRIMDDMTLIINEVKKLNLIIDAKTATPTEVKNARKRKAKLLEKKEPLIKKYNLQKEKLEMMDKQEKAQLKINALLEKKAAKKTNQKSDTKAKQKSGSKTTKPKSGSKTNQKLDTKSKQKSGSKTTKPKSGSKTTKSKSGSKTTKSKSGSKTNQKKK